MPRAWPAVPIPRIFSVENACEFCIDSRECQRDWERRLDGTAPLSLQVSRAGLALHLSEHHGEGSPGSSFPMDLADVRDQQAGLKDYRYSRPGISEPKPGEKVSP